MIGWDSLPPVPAPILGHHGTMHHGPSWHHALWTIMASSNMGHHGTRCTFCPFTVKFFSPSQSLLNPKTLFWMRGPIDTAKKPSKVRLKFPKGGRESETFGINSQSIPCIPNGLSGDNDWQEQKGRSLTNTLEPEEMFFTHQPEEILSKFWATKTELASITHRETRLLSLLTFQPKYKDKYKDKDKCKCKDKHKCKDKYNDNTSDKDILNWLRSQRERQVLTV